MNNAAFLVTGGYPDSNFQHVEVLKSNGTSFCGLSNLPDERRGHTLDGDFLCGGAETKVVLFFNSSMWPILPTHEKLKWTIFISLEEKLYCVPRRRMEWVSMGFEKGEV